MGIKPRCDKCGKELREFGGLLFSPPMFGISVVEKLHLCKKCFREVLAIVKPLRGEGG